MTPRRLATVLLVFVTVCRSHVMPASGSDTTLVARGPASNSAPARHIPDENDRRAELARGSVPGYAGDMVEGCNYVVLLTDTLRQAAAARRHFPGRRSDCLAGALLLRQVKYDFAQLNDWYAGPFKVVWREKGVTSSSIAIQRNRIEVGVRPNAMARVRQLVDSLPIPHDAIAVVPGMYACAGTGGPSVVVRVRDERGRPAAFGTTIVIQEGAYRDSVDGTHALSEVDVGAGERRPGTYEVRLYKPGYRPVVLHDVKAPGDTLCHYAKPTDIRDVTLALLPNAPPVRSIIVSPPGMGFGLPNLTEQMHATVDADSGISTAVEWSSSDTTVATVSPSGLLRSQCRTTPGEAVITATSRVDRTVRGHASVSVSRWASAAPCPASR
ncbi:MAG: Ig domain-containing protein [Gemmatimonadaceae bacterium]